MFKADLVFKNGNIITMNKRQPRVEAVAVWGDKIIAAGSNGDVEVLTGPGTKVVNLAGRTLMPGFNDAHSHMLMYGTVLMEIDVSSPQVSSIEEIKALVAEKGKTCAPGEWIRGWGYDDSKLVDKRQPNRWDLDLAAPEHPVTLTRTCGHMIAVNSKALELAGINRNTPDPYGGEIVRDPASGEPVGILMETAQDLVKKLLPPYSGPTLVEAIKLMSDKYLSQGITSGADASTLFTIKNELKAWGEAREKGYLRVRTYLMMGQEIAANTQSLGLQCPFGDNMLKLGSIKMFSDGGVGGASAALIEPYAHQPGYRGILYMNQEEFDRNIKNAHDAGFQISIHAIGDQAIDMVLNSFEKALKANPRTNHRHRVEHCQVCAPRQRKRVVDLGLIPVMQPGFFYSLGDSHINNLGRERVAWEFPVKSMLDLGAIVPGSSDRPVINGNPIYGLYCAVTRKCDSGDCVGTGECISIEDALRMFTHAGAYATFEENIKGTIEPGKLADLIIPSSDPTRIEPAELLNLKIEMTMVGGNVVYGSLS